MAHSTPPSVASPGLHILDILDDITTEIFLRCLPAHGRVSPSRKTTPLLLSQVCSQGRAIAHTTSEIWCSLDLPVTSTPHFEFNPSDNGYGPRSPADILPDADAFLRTWFLRAKMQPLALTLRSSYVGASSCFLIESLSPPESLLPNLAALKITAWAMKINFDKLIAILEARASTLVLFHLALQDDDPFEDGFISREQFDRICVNGFKITWDQQPRTHEHDPCSMFGF
ncbi:hypothetical protein C8R44DRAFT_884911 [Mycena epipterygia]|nr:hypothetical protein C8R44DRAFT_884911 [Mycena epipterygia]